MDMKTYLKQATPEEREELAVAVDSSVGYFYLIAGGHRKAGTDLCKALVAAEPKLTLSGLRPDIWEDLPVPIQPNIDPAASDCHTPATSIPGTPIDGSKVREAKNGSRKVPPDVKGVAS